MRIIIALIIILVGINSYAGDLFKMNPRTQQWDMVSNPSDYVVSARFSSYSTNHSGSGGHSIQNNGIALAKRSIFDCYSGLQCQDRNGKTRASVPISSVSNNGLMTKEDKKKLAITLNPYDFGIVGDGATDDTSAMQAYMDYAVAHRPVTAELPPKLKFTAPINIVVPQDNEVLFIKGNNTVIMHSGDYGDTFAIRSSDDIDGTTKRVDMSGITFDTDVAMTTGAHIHARNLTGSNWDKLILLDGLGGIWYEGGINNNLSNSRINSGHGSKYPLNNNCYGLKFTRDSAMTTTSVPTLYTFTNVDINNNRESYPTDKTKYNIANGIIVNSADTLIFNGCHVNYTTISNLELAPTAGTFVADIKFTGGSYLDGDHVPLTPDTSPYNVYINSTNGPVYDVFFIGGTLASGGWSGLGELKRNSAIYNIGSNTSDITVTSCRAPFDFDVAAYNFINDIVGFNAINPGHIELDTNINFKQSSGIVFGAKALTFDDTNGRIGIDTSSPQTRLHLIEESAASDRGIRLGMHVDPAVSRVGSSFSWERSGGDYPSPAAVDNGTEIGILGFRGHDGSTYQAPAQIIGYVSGAVSTGVVPVSLSFRTGTSTATRADRLTISPTGASVFTGSVTAPTFSDGTTTKSITDLWTASAQVLPETVVSASGTVNMTAGNAYTVTSSGVTLTLPDGSINKPIEINTRGVAVTITGNLIIDGSSGTSYTTATYEGIILKLIDASNIWACKAKDKYVNPNGTSQWTSVTGGINYSGGYVGIGQNTPTNALDILSSADSNVLSTILVKNTNSTGTSAQSAVKANADTATAQLIANGSAKSGARYGINIAGYGELLSGAGNGLLIGTGTNGKDIIFGTNSAERGRMPSDGGFRLISATEQNCDATHKGTFNYVAGGAGVKDTVKVCTKDAADAYAWRTIY